MSQTIICEYLAKWEETGIAPETTEFGFDGGIYGMLVECQDVMLNLGTAANDGKRRIAELESTLRQEAVIQETEKDKHIAYLEAMVGYYRGIEPHAKARITELEAQARQMFAIIEDRDRQLADAQKTVKRLLIEQELDAMEES